MAKNRGLGRGLDSLISTKYSDKKKEATVIEVASARSAQDAAGDAAKSAVAFADGTTTAKSGISAGLTNSEGSAPQLTGAEEKINISLISPNKEQPRKKFDEEALNELAESIKQHGIISPLILVKKDKGYEIIAGERRFRAAKMAGLKEVPAIVRDYTEEKASEIAIIENIQREDLNAIEEAKAYEKLINDYGFKQDDLAKRMSKSRASITNHLRLLKLSDKIQKLVIDGKISEGHARALLSTDSEARREKIAEKIVKEKLSVREVEQLLKERTNVRKNKLQTKQTLEGEEFYEKLEEDLKETLGTKVAIKRKSEEKGSIQIDYYSIEDLERLTNIFKKGGRAR